MSGVGSRHAFALLDRYGHLEGRDLLAAMMKEAFSDRLAIVSSFGTESAVLLHIAAQINPDIPVLFLDTGKLFGETLRYRRTLVEFLGLTNVRSVEPDSEVVSKQDPKGHLWAQNPNQCCLIRKVQPLARALKDFDAWITGRKAFQSSDRAALAAIEADGPRVKINPLLRWSRADIDAYFVRHELPHHPLEADGYASIGCMPCTTPVAVDEDVRAGRWRGQDKTECGIHMSTLLETSAVRS